MLFLKSTTVTKAPGIYDVDIAAKPPGKTFGVFLATDPDNPPAEVLAQLAALGFKQTYSGGYTHKDRGKVLANMAAITALFGGIGITIAPRVMSLAEAYA
jgi:hypothetical protein